MFMLRISVDILSCLCSCLHFLNNLLINFGFYFLGFKPTAEIISVSIEPCDKQPCKLIRGSSTSIAIKFKPTIDITKLKTIVKGKVAGFWISFPLENKDACSNGGLTCPMKVGQEYTYKFSLPVQKVFPTVST